MPTYSNDQLYIIKMKNQATALNQFREYLTKSENNDNPPAYYYLTAATSKHDRDVFMEMKMDVYYRCALLDYEGDKISCIYWCICHKYIGEGKMSIHCKLRYKTKEESVIENFIYNLHLNLETDFPGDSYLNFEISEPLIKQMRKFETKPFVQEKAALVYEDLEEENSLSPLAQRNQYCRRKYNLRPPQQRGEFQRDHDRIVYSKAFRRMVDKAQIFSSAKGDHYTDETVTNNSLIVECGDKSCYISYSDIYLYETDFYSYGYTSASFDGEGAITSAIDYVVSDELPQLYLLEGHGEAELPQTFQEQLEKDNIETQPLIDENYYPIVPVATGLTVSGSASGATVTELLTTSDSAFSKVSGYEMTTYDEEEGDMDGPFAVAVSVERNDGGEMVWFSSSLFLDDGYNAYSSGANVNLTMNALSQLIGEREAMSIRSKSLNYNYLTINESTASLLKVTMIGVFPLIYLAVGIGVVVKRRRMQHEPV